MMRMMHSTAGVWVSWEKGSDLRKIELHGPLGTDSKTHYFSIEDVGDKWDARVKWNVGDKAIGSGMDSVGMRELARELLRMADVIDKRAGRPLPKNPLEEDSLAQEFFSVLDPRSETK